MNRRPAVVLVALATMALPAPADARAPLAPDHFDQLVRAAEHVVIARALGTKEGHGTFDLVRRMKGTMTARRFTATPRNRPRCTRPPLPTDHPPIEANAQVVLFLVSETGGEFPVVDSGQGWITVDPDRKEEMWRTVARVITIEETPETRIAAYLEAVESEDRMLRRTARSVIQRELSPRKMAKAHEPRLVELLRSKWPEARDAALCALHAARSEEGLPLIIAAIRDVNATVRSAACRALWSDDRPEARAALVEALSHEDMRVRRLAATKFSRDARRKDLSIIQLLHGLLSDEASEVRIAAARGLANSDQPQTLEFLRSALQREGIDPGERKVLISSVKRVKEKTSPSKK